MARKSRKLKGRRAIAIIVDGETEQWYLNQTKKDYVTREMGISVKPELADKKSVKELFDLAKTYIESEYDTVILVIDLDDVRSNPKERNDFIAKYKTYLSLRGNGRAGKNNVWMKNLKIIVNNPCIEFWYLLHFKRTTKLYDRYEPHLKIDLRKCDKMEAYDKTEDFYFNPDIYDRLNRVSGIEMASNNTTTFSLESMDERGSSDMHILFSFLESLR